MERNSVLKFGGISAFVVGILYLLVGATHFLLPRSQLRGAGGVDSSFFVSLAKTSLVFEVHYWIVALLALFGIAVLLAYFELLRPHRTGILCWSAVVGVIGAALSIVDFAFVAVEVPRIAERFVDSKLEIQSALLMMGMPHLDPCFLAWGLGGVWAIASNCTALRHKLIPPLLGYLGILGGVLFELVFLGAALQSPTLVDISVGLGGFFVGPIWYIWMGFVLRRDAVVDSFVKG